MLYNKSSHDCRRRTQPDGKTVHVITEGQPIITPVTIAELNTRIQTFTDAIAEVEAEKAILIDLGATE